MADSFDPGAEHPAHCALLLFLPGIEEPLAFDATPEGMEEVMTLINAERIALGQPCAKTVLSFLPQEEPPCS